MSLDVNQVVRDFMASIPQLSPSQFVLVMNQLTLDMYRRMMQ